MELDALLIVTSGERRYALPQQSVQSLQRRSPGQATPALGALLSGTATEDEPYALVLRPSERSAALLVGVRQADLRDHLPQLALPSWLARLAHPAITGLALDGADLIPLIDIVQLAHHTGYETT